jgi:hypothetical protein
LRKKISENNRLTSFVIKKFDFAEWVPFARILRREMVMGQREKPGTAKQIHEVSPLFCGHSARCIHGMMSDIMMTKVDSMTRPVALEDGLIQSLPLQFIVHLTLVFSRTPAVIQITVGEAQ